MKCRNIFAIISVIAMLLLLVGCSNGITGQAVASDSNITSTTASVDDVTARFNKAVKGVDSDESLEKISVSVTEDGEVIDEVTTTTTTTLEEVSTTIVDETVANESLENESETQAAGLTVTIASMALTPKEAYIKPGETVMWLNKEEFRSHLIASMYSQEFRSPLLKPGDTFNHTFEEKGTYEYWDSTAPDKIRGKIIVK